MRKYLILLPVLACVGCAAAPADREADPGDPGDAAYPNLGVFPRAPARPTAEAAAAQQARLARQRDEARAFDTTLRALDPALDPSARPPPPPSFAPSADPSPQPAAAPQAAPAPASAPLPPAMPAVRTVPAVVPAPAQLGPSRPVPAPPPVVAAAQTSWIIGTIGYGEGTALLTAESRRLLRDAVVAATERGGRIRVAPLAAGALSPAEHALAARRAAAAVGEIEALGLDRARVIVDPGAFKAARIAVEF